MPKQSIENNSTSNTSTTSVHPKSTSAASGSKPKQSRSTKTTSVNKPSSTRSKATPGSKSTAVPIANDTRQRLIQETAYYIAEQRGFSGGDPVQDWILAEYQVSKMLGQH